MKKIELYEPAMCCETGVCGVEVDPVLLKINSLTKELKKEGYDIERYNLGQAPDKFVANELVSKLMQAKGADVFPLLLIDNEVVIEGRYPTDDEIKNLFNITLGDQVESEGSQNGCCN